MANNRELLGLATILVRLWELETLVFIRSERLIVHRSLLAGLIRSRRHFGDDSGCNGVLFGRFAVLN